jgi:proline iminopeptidase
MILFDPRSCGKSEACPKEFCTLDHYIDDVEAIRQLLNIPSKHFFVFGQSYGSIVALGYAIRYPGSLKKLLLIGGVASSTFYDEAKAKLKEIGSPAQIAFAEKLWNGAFDGSKQEMIDFYTLMSPLYSYSFEPGEPPLEIGYNIEVMNEGWGKFLKQFDYTQRLHQMTCETLILWGENEWIMPKSHIDLMRRSIPKSSLKIYPECMHMLWIDQWERFVQDALAFLS